MGICSADNAVKKKSCVYILKKKKKLVLNRDTLKLNLLFLTISIVISPEKTN